MASWWAQACGSEVLGSRGKLKSLMALGLMTRWKAQGINALRIRKILLWMGTRLRGNGDRTFLLRLSSSSSGKQVGV